MSCIITCTGFFGGTRPFCHLAPEKRVTDCRVGQSRAHASSRSCSLADSSWGGWGAWLRAATEESDSSGRVSRLRDVRERYRASDALRLLYTAYVIKIEYQLYCTI